jgi:hypothetical protein
MKVFLRRFLNTFFTWIINKFFTILLPPFYCYFLAYFLSIFYGYFGALFIIGFMKLSLNSISDLIFLGYIQISDIILIIFLAFSPKFLCLKLFAAFSTCQISIKKDSPIWRVIHSLRFAPVKNLHLLVKSFFIFSLLAWKY